MQADGLAGKGLIAKRGGEAVGVRWFGFGRGKGRCSVAGA